MITRRFPRWVLVAVGIGFLAGLMLRGCTTRSLTGDERQTKVLLLNVVNAAHEFKGAHGRWPESLEAMIKHSSELFPPHRFLKGKLVDSWGEPLQYVQPGPDHEGRVWSLGAEGRGDPRLEEGL